MTSRNNNTEAPTGSLRNSEVTRVFRSSEDASNYYLKNTAHLLNDILKCVEEKHDRYECREPIELLSKNLYEYKHSIKENEEKLKRALEQAAIFEPPQFSQPVITFKEMPTRRGQRHNEEEEQTRIYRETNTTSNPTFLKSVGLFFRKIIGGGDE